MNVSCALVLAVLFCIEQPVQEDAPINLGETSSIGGEIHFCQVAGNQFAVLLPRKARGPRWTADEENSPLSAADAIRLATKKRQELIPEDLNLDWKLLSASLKPLDGDDGFWCWEVTFGEVHDREHFCRELRLFVMMDGKVLEPSVEDDSFNQSELLDLPPSKK